MQRVRWGVIGTGRIGLDKVIPAMQRGQLCDIEAIASRAQVTARTAAERLGIPRAYGSYEALLDDPRVEAVYITLPNHLHVPWSIRALESGKHVLCEKPIGLDSRQAEQLLEVAERHPRLKVMEAFMYRHHPQWRRVLEIVRGGEIGELRTIQSIFTYHNVDPLNVRNQHAIGGGGMLDVGCYAVSLSRFVFGAEPVRVVGIAELDAVFHTDTLTSGILDFGRGHATFTCATRLAPYQRVNIFGTEGRVELEIPFNAPPDAPHRLWLQRGSETTEAAVGYHDQYQIQGDLFARSIRDDVPVPTPLADAVANMRVIDALFQSAETGSGVEVTPPSSLATGSSASRC